MRLLRGLAGACLAGVILTACAGAGFEGAPPPEWQDPALQPNQVWTTDDGQGIELAYNTYGVTQSGQPAILFLHGWCENRWFWKPTATALQERTLCVTVDLPGYGDSSDAGAPADPVVWAQRLAEFAMGVHDGPWVVVGHSLGGVVALETARHLQTAERASGVVVVHGLYDPSREFDKEMTQAFAASMQKDFTGQIDAYVNALVPPRSAGALSGWVANQMKATEANVAIAGLEALEGYDLITCLKALKVPVRAINAGMRATNRTANQRLIADFDVFILESIDGPGLDLMLQDPVGFRALLDRALQEFSSPSQE